MERDEGLGRCYRCYRTPPPEAKLRSHLAELLCLFLNLAKVGFNFLQALHQSCQVVGIAEPAAVKSIPFHPPDQPHFFQICDVALDLTRPEAEPFSQGFLAGERLALFVPPVVAELK